MYQRKPRKLANNNKLYFSIGEVSKIVDLSQKTIRDYERMGLIRPRRAPKTNNRIYSMFDIGQIQHITRLIHEEGFTLQCLRYIFHLAPCWNVFGCEVKEQCSAFRNPNMPCYEIRNSQDTLCSGSCEFCAIYINRDLKRKKILDRPTQVGNPK